MSAPTPGPKQGPTPTYCPDGGGEGHAYATHMGTPVSVQRCCLCGYINWADLAEQVTALTAKVTRERDSLARRCALRYEETEKLRALVDDLRGPDPCWYDHHGHCQAHGWTKTDPTCPHARAAELFAEGGEGPMSAPTPEPAHQCIWCGATANLTDRVINPDRVTKMWECEGGACPVPPPDLDALERLLTAASPAPWSTGEDGLVWSARAAGDPVSGSTEIPDAELIAAARNALPALIERAREADRLRPVVDAVRRAADEYEGHQAELPQNVVCCPGCDIASGLAAAVDALGADAPVEPAPGDAWAALGPLEPADCTCGHPEHWHQDGRCAGDLLHCPCKGYAADGGDPR